MATEKTEEALNIAENPDGSASVNVPGSAREGAGAVEEDDAAPVHGVDRGAATDDEPTEAEELNGAPDDSAREAIRERRRKERKDKRAAAQERERQLNARLQASDRQNSELRERINVIERKTSGSELAQLDNAIHSAEAAAETYKNMMGEAANRSDGAAQAEALEQMIVARERARDLKHVRQRMANPPQQRLPGPDPELVRHAQNWMSQNKWYNPQGTDLDSRFVLAIDQTLAEEGFAPNTEAYWSELTQRVKNRLPHRAGGGGNGDILAGDAQTGDKRSTRSVVTGSGREAAGNGNRGSAFTLSSARVQALKDAGMWEDSSKRNEMIRDFIEYDRAHPEKS